MIRDQLAHDKKNRHERLRRAATETQPGSRHNHINSPELCWQWGYSGCVCHACWCVSCVLVNDSGKQATQGCPFDPNLVGGGCAGRVVDRRLEHCRHTPTAKYQKNGYLMRCCSGLSCTVWRQPVSYCALILDLGGPHSGNLWSKPPAEAPDSATTRTRSGTLRMATKTTWFNTGNASWVPPVGLEHGVLTSAAVLHWCFKQQRMLAKPPSTPTVSPPCSDSCGKIPAGLMLVGCFCRQRLLPAELRIAANFGIASSIAPRKAHGGRGALYARLPQSTTIALQLWVPCDSQPFCAAWCDA